MSNVPPPMGFLAYPGLGFDSMTIVLGVTGLVMIAGLGLLLWALRARDRVTYRVRCPEHGTEAIIEVRMPRGDDVLDVERCSLCDPPRRVDCGKRCIELVA